MPAVPTTTLYMLTGEDFENILDLEYDLTGFEVKAIMKRSYFTENEIEFETNIVDAEAGDVSIKLPNEITKNLWPTRYVFTVMIKSFGELYYPVLQGVIVVDPSTVNTNF